MEYIILLLISRVMYLLKALGGTGISMGVLWEVSGVSIMLYSTRYIIFVFVVGFLGVEFPRAF